MTEVCEAECNWHGKSSQVIGQQQETCLTGPRVQIPCDICTRFGRYLYSTKCSWIIMPTTTCMYFTTFCYTVVHVIGKSQKLLKSSLISF